MFLDDGTGICNLTIYLARHKIDQYSNWFTIGNNYYNVLYSMTAYQMVTSQTTRSIYEWPTLKDFQICGYQSTKMLKH